MRSNRAFGPFSPFFQHLGEGLSGIASGRYATTTSITGYVSAAIAVSGS